MEQLKEIRVSNGVLILDGHRVLSPIIPESYREVDRDILVRGEAVVDGAVYTRKLDLASGPLTVHGALFAKESIIMPVENEKAISFEKAVACSGVISLCGAGRKHFRADVNGATVCLRNAVVAANVFAGEAVLEDCVILGGVFATKSLTITNSVVGTFNAPSASIVGNNYILYPSVFSVEPLHVAPEARLFNLTLADWGALLKGLPENMRTGMVEIDIEADDQRVTLKDGDGNVTLWQSYSIAGKVLASDLLDMKKLDNHFMLSAGALGGQLIKQYDFGCDRQGKPIVLSLETLGAFFTDIQTGRIKVKTLDGAVSFDELKSFYAES